MYTTHAGQLRLNVRATGSDGSRWVKVMSPADFSTLQDWAAAGDGLSEDVSQAAGTAVDEELRTYLRSTPA